MWLCLIWASSSPIAAPRWRPTNRTRMCAYSPNMCRDGHFGRREHRAFARLTLGETISGVHPGGFLDRAPLRRDGARPCPLAQARAHDGRRCDGDERAGQGLGVHGAAAGGLNVMNLPRRRLDLPLGTIARLVQVQKPRGTGATRGALQQLRESWTPRFRLHYAPCRRAIAA
jgi:hypothetical protein